MKTDDAGFALQRTFFSRAPFESRHEERKVLIVGEPAQAAGLRELLEPEGYVVAAVGSTDAADDLYLEFEPDVLLLDVEASGLEGFNFCRRLMKNYGAEAAAVIFIARHGEPAEIVEGLAAGGVDFLTGSSREQDVLARLGVHILNRERLLQRKRDEDAKNRLLCVAAHDLRNPLVSIRALTNLIRAGTAGEVAPQQRELLDTIYDASQSMLDLVNELLDVSVYEAGELKLTPRPTSLAMLVEACARLNNATAAQKGSNIVLVPGDLPPVLSLDEPKVWQVLNNLLGNAIKFSPPASTITVQTWRTADECIVSVQDQGPGVREGERDRLFKDFSRTSVKPTGGESSTGLGLSICYKIMQAHAGRIEVGTAAGGGADFRISFPLPA